MQNRKTKRASHKHLIITLAILLLAVVIMITLELTNTTHLFHKSAIVRPPTAPITQLPTQKSTNNGVKSPTTTNGVDQGGATDKNGQVPSGVSTDPSQWSTSTSGVITLKLPLANSTVESGQAISGSASVGPVQYRLIDDQVGVIAQGPINVVGGNFTASLSFTPHSGTGRLDVFNTEDSGREINEVQIAVKF